MIQIVVARHHECIRWTKHFDNVVIYNNGKPLVPSEYNEVSLPKNVGREGHTYYTYICQNYDNLPDYVIFLQGYPADHSPRFNENIKKYKESPTDFEFISDTVEHTTFENERKRHWQCKNIYDTYEKIFGVKCDITSEIIFGHGAQFAVSKRAILRRPREFYENIVRMLEYHVNPLEGYDVERLHKLIFDQTTSAKIN